MNVINKVVRLGSVPIGGETVNVFCRISFVAEKLSISGVEGPMRNGDCRGGCGQIDMHLRDAQDTINLAPGWTREMLARFFEVWRQWHLNDMKAGTPEQEAELEKHKFPGYPASHYEWAKEVLAAAGLEPHNGYSYGSEWLKQEVPADVLEFLGSLPETDTTPAWV